MCESVQQKLGNTNLYIRMVEHITFLDLFPLDLKMTHRDKSIRFIKIFALFHANPPVPAQPV